MASRCLLRTLVLLGVVSSVFGRQECRHECQATCSKKYIWLSGEDVVWNCTLAPANCENFTAEDIRFARGRNRFPDNFTEIVSPKSRQLRIPQAQPCANGICSYYAYVGEGCDNTASIEMKIGEVPQRPEMELDYNIISNVASTVRIFPKSSQTDSTLQWDFHYTFDGSQRFILPSTTQTSLDAIQGNLPKSRDPEYLNENCKQYQDKPECTGSDPLASYPCDCPSQDRSACTLTNAGLSKCFFDRIPYSFRVNVSNTYGFTISTLNFTLSDEIARAPKVQNLSKQNVSSRGAEIKWEMYDKVDVRYQVTLCWDEEVCQEPQETADPEFNLTNLTPNTKYRVWIHTRMKANKQWGSEKWIDFSTLEDIPDSSPGVSPGSYTFSEEGLYLYTKEIPNKDRNGNLTYIFVALTNQTETKEYRRPASNSTLFMAGITQSAGCRVKIQGCTAVGCSKNLSVLDIPQDSVAPPKPQHVVAERQNADQVKVFWHINEKENLEVSRVRFIVHVCQVANRLSSFPDCVVYYWVMVEGDGNVAEYNVTIPSSAQIDNFRLGVSMMAGNFSSEVAWVACLYDAGTGLPEAKRIPIFQDLTEEQGS